MSDIFVSWTQGDAAAARAVEDGLREAGFAIVDTSAAPGDATLNPDIAAAIAAAKLVVVLWSPASLESDAVRDAAARGRERNTLLPVFIADCAPPFGFASFQAAHLVGWTGDPGDVRWRRLLGEVADRLGAAGAEAPAATPPVDAAFEVPAPVETPPEPAGEETPLAEPAPAEAVAEPELVVEPEPTVEPDRAPTPEPAPEPEPKPEPESAAAPPIAATPPPARRATGGAWRLLAIALAISAGAALVWVALAG